MKKQSGFTLIELLLVLAIIGIISAIAIPALLGQRARARDKATISNMEGRIGDLVGQYDRLKEAGTSPGTIVTQLQAYLTQTSGKDYNPWNPSQPAFPAGCVTPGTDRTASAAATTVAGMVNNPGDVAFVVSPPQAAVAATSTASAVPAGAGFIAGAAAIQNPVNGTNKFTKVSAVE
jgi:prepilin-type N-terminal cleavage/methylation domain-containing protein